MADLRKLCTHFIWTSLDVSDVFAVWDAALQASCDDVALACLTFVEKNPESFQSAAFERAPPDIMRQVLASGDLCVDEVCHWGISMTCAVSLTIHSC